MEDYFTTLDAAQIRNEYWDYDDESEFCSMNAKRKLCYKRSTRKKILSQFSQHSLHCSSPSYELQFDHDGLAPPLPNYKNKHLSEYVIGQQIQLEIGFPDSDTPAPRECLLVEVIQHLGQPWRSAA